jgi:hypothetical protein
MSDGGAPFQPGVDGVTVPFHPRAAYTGYRAFGRGDGAVLMAPSVAHDLRSAARRATAERRIAGGLLYGRGWADELGTYLVIDHYLEAGAGDGSGDTTSGDGNGHGDFSLSEAGLRRLREEAARLHPGFLEAGWWRTCDELGEFGPRDFVTQGELVGPDGVGLLVYGSGVYWGTAYLGPDGHAPDSAGTLAVVPDPAAGPDAELPPGPAPAPAPEAGIAPEPELVDIAAGESLAQEPPPVGPVPPPRRVRRSRAASGYGIPRRYGAPRGYGLPRRRGARLAGGEDTGAAPELPADTQFVVGALMAVVVAAAIIIGFIVSSLIVAVIIGAVGILVIASMAWITHRY